MTVVEYEKWDSFVEPPSRCDDVEIILGESCVLLINSSVAGYIIFFWIEDANHRFKYLYEQIYFP